MEVLNGIIDLKARRNNNFTFHWKCEATHTVMLAFADDLLLFSHADVSSIRILKECLEEFHWLSGLSANTNKSEIFICSKDPALIQDIVDILGFKVGSLPIRYLGVPLISTRLSVRDCTILTEKITRRIKSWKNRWLSFGGRLQLVASILSSVHLYWASIFILPKSILKQIDCIKRRFLWNGSSEGKTNAKVAWADICYPKSEGGLGLKNLQAQNKALICKLLWRILSKDPDSAWSSWVHKTRIKDRCIWTLKVPDSAPWSWKKIMNLRPVMCAHTSKIIGDGMDTFVWQDHWHPHGPLSRVCSDRIPSSFGLSEGAKVSRLSRDEHWAWPNPYDREVSSIAANMPHHLPNAERKDSLKWGPLHISRPCFYPLVGHQRRD
ncbi:hypothetical protein Nepgr_032276 [Nepenthes gracilis]|uniref:Uncharacterized protein n=1 Tax=Nepenthes gracilis TaxID=150966 RepID=A0AAD3Y5X3_NEPGR|nr:hypothetical protein Nepgr_032276 [Nepenthes gracilis]